MKKIIFLLINCTLIYSCNNSGKTDPVRAQADSLQKQVIDEHDVAMPKAMKIPKLKKEIQQQIDSINKLPTAEQEAAASYKDKLEILSNDLTLAHEEMQQWMNAFNLDSFSNDPAKRVQYLTDEKKKVTRVKEEVLQSLQKADSVIKH